MADDDYLKPILDLAAAVGTKGVTSAMRWPEQIANTVQSNVDAAKLPGDVVTGRVDPMSDEGIKRAVDLAGSMTLGAGAMEAPAGALHAGLMRPKSEGIIAYHGSPHSFDRFDLSKIGTGEGAQAYGHGLYFAEAEPVAKQYREFLSSRNNDLTDPGNLAASLLYRTPQGTRDAAIREAQTVLRSIERMPAAYKHDPGVAERTQRALEMLQSGAELPAQGGHMYQVRINADPEHFLDWDRPLSEHSPAVLDYLHKRGLVDFDNNVGPSATGEIKPLGWTQNAPAMTGEKFYRRLTEGKFAPEMFLHGTPKGAAQADVSSILHEAGIPGIKYLDQGSRAAGEGSRNYVVFDDNLIDILRKYAKGGEVDGLLQDRYPSHYMPGVGRQVMQDGGAPNYSAPITGQHTITLDDLIGRAPGPASQMGAYTDAGGQKIASPFVTSTAGGYPVYAPVTPAKADASSSAKDPMRRFIDLFERGGYAGGGRAGALADVVARAVAVAKELKPSERIVATHSLDSHYIPKLADQYGAIPAPSVALSKPLAAPVGFGEATLVGKPHLAVPTHDNPVFAADAYTPRFPEHLQGASLEDVLNHVRSQPVLGGEGVAGVGLLKAMMSPEFKTIEDIQKTRPRMAADHEEEARGWEALRNSAIGAGGLLSPFAREKSNYPGDQFINAMADYIRHGQEGLDKHYSNIPPLRKISIQNFLGDLKSLSPDYYEAKPLRGVGIDEFAGAVIPMDAPGREAAGALVRSGMPEQNIHFFNDSNPDTRREIIRSKFGDYGFAEGGDVEQPGDRAHRFVQDMLYGDVLKPSPLVDQYSGKTADAALAANADRPMPTAHEFVQHQLNKDEPQLPQFDRAARDKMRDYAIDALHGAAYFTPLAPAAAAYDAYKGLQSGDPVEMGLAAAGLPGRSAKAAMLAAGVMSPTDAEASPYTAFLKGVVERMRPHYDPTAMVKGMPDKKWLSEVALSRPLDQMKVKKVDQRELIPHQLIDPADLEGKALITGMGDRTPAGYKVIEINGRKLTIPVDMQGGAAFSQDIAAQHDDPAFWASNSGRATELANRIVKAASQGHDPVFTYVAQGPQSGDFSHMMLDTVLGQLRRNKMDKGLVEKFDKVMREKQTASGKPFEPAPDWPGITNKNLRNILLGDSRGGAWRTKMTKLMDAAAYRDAPGWADVGAARAATTHPDLVNDPTFSAGYMFARPDPTGRLLKDHEVGHTSYDTLLASADRKPGYIGGLEYPLPPEVHFKNYLENEIDQSLRGKPFSQQTMSLRMSSPTVMATPEWTDMASEYQDLMRQEYGRRLQTP